MDDLPGAKHILIVDDDEVSREVLAVLFASEGYAVSVVADGDEALAAIEGDGPGLVLTDVQMPGISGPALAEGVRRGCRGPVRVMAMSGSQPPAARLAGYDGFLLKPFTVEDFEAALQGGAEIEEIAPADKAAMLDEAAYKKLCAAMAPAQVKAMFAFCLDDAAMRIERMRGFEEAGDDAGFRKEAHTIAGGCGMVGAVELKGLARSMEAGGLGESRTYRPAAMLAEFVLASERLRRMLDTYAG